MLIYGTAHNAWLIGNNVHIYNFTSLYQGFPNRINLIPPNNLGAINEYDFDVRYMQWILEVDANFIEFMKIIMDLYTGNDIFIAVDNDEWSNVLVESLLKLIQDRYGIIAIKVDSPDDLVYAKDYSFNREYGIMNLDADKQRLTYLVERSRQQGA